MNGQRTDQKEKSERNKDKISKKWGGGGGGGEEGERERERTEVDRVTQQGTQHPTLHIEYNKEASLFPTQTDQEEFYLHKLHTKKNRQKDRQRNTTKDIVS